MAFTFTFVTSSFSAQNSASGFIPSSSDDVMTFNPGMYLLVIESDRTADSTTKPTVTNIGGNLDQTPWIWAVSGAWRRATSFKATQIYYAIPTASFDGRLRIAYTGQNSHNMSMLISVTGYQSGSAYDMFPQSGSFAIESVFAISGSLTSSLGANNVMFGVAANVSSSAWTTDKPGITLTGSVTDIAEESGSVFGNNGADNTDLNAFYSSTVNFVTASIVGAATAWNLLLVEMAGVAGEGPVAYPSQLHTQFVNIGLDW